LLSVASDVEAAAVETGTFVADDVLAPGALRIATADGALSFEARATSIVDDADASTIARCAGAPTAVAAGGSAADGPATVNVSQVAAAVAAVDEGGGDSLRATRTRDPSPPSNNDTPMITAANAINPPKAAVAGCRRP